MPRPLASPSRALGLLAAVGLAAACGSSGGNGDHGSLDGGGGDATIGGGDAGGAVNLNGGSDAGTAQSLAITPTASTLTVTSLTGPFPTQAFTATATFPGGTSAPVQAAWSIDRLDIASIDPNGGLLSPSGATFGLVTVSATAMGVSASTTLTVALKAVIDTAGLTPPQEATLAGASAPDPSVTSLAYPYDQTVFPRGLVAPQLMWNGGSAGDAYYVHLVGPSFDLGLFTKADPPSRFALPQAAWNALTTSAAAKSATTSLHRMALGSDDDGGAAPAYASAQESWPIADANLSGSIYYWAITEGQIIKLDLESGTISPAFDSGPSTSLDTPTPINSGSPASPPWEDNGAGKRCVACHSVSKDGSTLTSVFSRAGSTGPLGFYSFGTGTVEDISDYTQSVTYDALTPNGQFAVPNFSNETMSLMNTAAGTSVASGLDGVANLCDPSFSPDGTLFALSAGCSGGAGYPVEFDTANLGLYSFSATTAPFFTNPQTVLTSSGTGDAIAFPSFSPDSKFLFYQRGSYSRAKYGNNQHGVDDLYVAPAQPGATQIALANANGTGVLSADSAHLNYAPTVNPIAAGGYIWVVFTSPRDYGNLMVSPQGAAPNDASYANHKQLWVTAVDANIGTVDPSHPAFWLPGQDETSANFFGYWALAPCKPTPTDGGAPPSCSAGFDCCTGFCRVDGDAGAVCTGAPTGCHQEGEACTTTSDCCNGGAGILCTGGFCQASAPK